MPKVTVHGQEVPCRGILFDKDGTLLDFMPMWGAWATVLIGLLDEHLTTLDKEPMGHRKESLGLFSDQTGRIIGYDKAGPIAMGTEEEVTALLAWHLYAAGIPWNEATVLVRRYNKLAMQKLEQDRRALPLPGLPEFLENCHRSGIKLAVVTSDTVKETEKHLDWMGLSRYFPVVVGRDRVSKGKPDPEMALLAAQELGLTPQQCIVIGDSNGDMVMGKQASVVCTIGIAPDGDGKQYLLDANWVVRGYHELSVQ
ncbi:haloacid dehalogenase [Paenibacillus sp. 79R4]|uniref:HAD family hydrolase n=1 Tax=Paenibacillus sp. 79R4 TaxID=2212847 RepID=UPI0015BA5AC6|nr:HAD family hydrolase [Paenibacillus sp. 79R4]NWL87682.1 haloacid dehalogenase [Paenibacillus sp. 79R4]